MRIALAALVLAGFVFAADTTAPARHALLIVNTRYAALPELTGEPGRRARSLRSCSPTALTSWSKRTFRMPVSSPPYRIS
jgi:hypothetical protein